MAKVEVQVRHCFCCGLTPGAVLIGLYTLILYALLTGLASVALSETAWNGDKPIYEDCLLDALGNKSQKIVVNTGHNEVTFEDTSSYHCSFGMYTEEMKWPADARYVFLVIALCLYIPLVLASIILLAGVCLSLEWLLVPWLVLLPLDILRGLLSCLFIVLLGHGNLSRIATAIFFLGLQLLHISLWIIILAKFQRIRYRKRGLVYDGSAMGSAYRHPQPYAFYGPGPALPPPGSASYPPPGSAAYSPQSAKRLDNEYPPPSAGQQRFYDGQRY